MVSLRREACPHPERRPLGSTSPIVVLADHGCWKFRRGCSRRDGGAQAISGMLKQSIVSSLFDFVGEMSFLYEISTSEDEEARKRP